MKRMFLLGGILMCLLSACAFAGESMESTPDGSMVSSQTETPPPLFSETQRKTLETILLGDEDFIHSSRDGEQQEMVNIGDVRRTFTDSEEVIGRVTKFAVLDMDGDRECEIVLWVQTQYLDEGFEVLHWQEGEWYGYHFWFRAMEELKEDGTFISSDGAFDTGIEWLFFPEKGCALDTLYQSESYYPPDGELEMRYYANGKICSEKEFSAAWERQNAKTDVLWYELTPENIELAMEG